MAAKVTKKTSKTRKVKKPEATVTKPVELRKMQDIKPDHVTFAMSTDELGALLQLLMFLKASFKTLADNAALSGDLETGKVYNARLQISEVLFEKFRSLANIGEPENRNVH